MAAQLITYDLRRPGQDYKTLHDAIRNLGSDWWHCVDSTWIVITDLPVGQVRDRLATHIDSTDTLVVLTLTGAWASQNLSSDCVNWLRRYFG